VVSGTVFVVSAPSGTGKTSLVRALVDSTPGLSVSVSHTTRPARPGEVDGVHYHFVDPPEFEALRAGGALLEHAEVFGQYYGTSRESVRSEAAAGRDVLLVIDWQGHRQVRAALPGAVGVFILPPSLAELERRLRGRAQDADAVIARRLAEARAEVAHWAEFDYLVVNAAFEVALADLQAIIRAHRLARPVQGERLARLLGELAARDP
jgi:guanylate kinase